LATQFATHSSCHRERERERERKGGSGERERERERENNNMYVLEIARVSSSNTKCLRFRILITILSQHSNFEVF